MKPINTTISISYGDNTEKSNDGLRFEIILFQNKKKLRSHTFKHLLDEHEFSNTWERFTGLNSDDILKARTFLNQIQCPAQKLSNKVCECGCPVYNQCSYMLGDYEKEYCNAIESIIQQSIQTPLFSVFESTETRGQFLVCLSSHSIVVKAAEIENKQFNLATCYANNVSGECYVEFRSKNVNKIRYEAARGSIKWYSEETWGVVVKEKKQSKKKKNKHTPYQRGGAANYRQYLDDAFD